MLRWLKSLFKGPEPAGPTQEFRSFSTSESTISQDSIAPEGDAWRVTGGPETQTARLFEVPDPGLERCVLTYQARLKCEDLEGKAYLEMRCRLPGRGEFFSKGIQDAIEGTTDWASYETPFYLKQGQRPDLVMLNLVVEGPGTVWMRDVQLLHTPLK